VRQNYNLSAFFDAPVDHQILQHGTLNDAVGNLAEAAEIGSDRGNQPESHDT